MDIMLVCAAAFVAGMLNALAGGGSFLTLPALVWVGVPPVMANATGTAALLPGYLASAWALRDQMRSSAGVSVWLLVVLGLVGGVLGAGLLLLTSNEAFRGIVPWLLLFATVLFASGPWIQRRLSQHTQHRANPSLAGAGVVGVSAYGGYFNGGMGIIILALLRLLGVSNLLQANALKNLLSAVLTLIAVLIYLLGGLVEGYFVWFMAVAATVGGLLGAKVGRILSPVLLRNLIIVIGALTTLAFFLKH